MPDNQPIEGLLFCPFCHKQHIDRPPWDKKPHTTHLCEFCDKEFDVSHPQVYGVDRPIDPTSPSLKYESFFMTTPELHNTIGQLRARIQEDEVAGKTGDPNGYKVKLDWWFMELGRRAKENL